VLAHQVRAALSGVDRTSRDEVVIVYEPVTPPISELFPFN
jgi:hypothetical protein